MSDEKNPRGRQAPDYPAPPAPASGQEGYPAAHGVWQPTPQGEYDYDATAFVQLPPEESLDAAPLEAPGHDYVPPMILPLTPAADPQVPAAWRVPHDTGGTPAHPGQGWPEPADHHRADEPHPMAQHAADVHGVGPHATDGHGLPGAGQAGEQHATHGTHGADPHATEQWAFPDVSRQQPDVTGQWTIPVARGDLPDETGEFTTAMLKEQWSSAPATLPGGATAPWAVGTVPEPVAEPVTEPVTEPVAEPEPPVEPASAPEPAGAPVPDEAVAPAPAAAPAPAPEEGAVAAPGALLEEARPRAGDPAPPQAAPAPGAPAAAVHPEPAVEHAVAPSRTATAESATPAEHPRTGPDALPGEVLPGDGPAGRPADEAPEAVALVGEAPSPEAPVLPDTGADADADVDVDRDVDLAPEPVAEAPEFLETAPGPVSGTPVEPVPVPAADAPLEPAPEPAREQAADTPHDTAALAEASAPADEAAAAAPTHAPVDEHPLISYRLRVNGADCSVTGAWIGESLLYVLRERLGLAGAKDGCSQGECGACNVQVDGRLVASCLVPAATTAGSEVRTVEGLATDGEPSDVQRALAVCGAVQCGFCIPGMAMTVHDLLEGNHSPTELETRQALCGNLCRCSGYRGVLDAVRHVVAEREASAAAAEAENTGAEDPGAPPAPLPDARIPHQAPPGAGSVQPHPHDGGMA
ncbi:(2Fe-2S)-binding protein [Streptomyces yaizuensis]|uniref:(2Fe-2S)-binding protein n=1 Tax=Streptomyces yaizuensis TaxID=2989713 RepID=A0ABQ5NTJ4_9ACTN|nr:2Fe-2S iron-sulfur cluster-binding protein [Streptomyces sp. YSPA8]GLF93458.1 (2Fe-2S)-binding protein [Streptomyces sp. YSPA8]